MKNPTEVTVLDNKVTDVDRCVPETHVQDGNDIYSLKESKEPAEQELKQADSGNNNQHQQIQINTYDWVAVECQRQWIMTIETNDNGDCLMTFPQLCSPKNSSRHAFKWLSSIDEKWIDFKKILCKIHSPEPDG